METRLIPCEPRKQDKIDDAVTIGGSIQRVDIIA